MNGAEEPLARLREADPATAHETDLTGLRAAVDQRIDTALRVDEVASRRERRGRRTAWLGAVAACALVGVAGYGLGSADVLGGQHDSSADSVAAESEPEAATLAHEGDGSGELGPQDLPGEGAVTYNGATDLSMVAGWSRAVWSAADGLGVERTSGEVFVLDATGHYSEMHIRDLAAALGVEGDPVELDGSWSLTDGAGRSIWLYADGYASVGYYDPSVDPWACVEVDCSPETDAPVADAVGEAEALLAAVGVDVSQYDVSIASQDERSTEVRAQPAGTQQYDPRGWSIQVTSEGVASAWGSLAQPVSLGEYDLVSPVEAVDRLMDTRFGDGGLGVMPFQESFVNGTPSIPTAGDRLAWPVTEYTVTTAELVAASHESADGAVVVAPTWLLSDAEGRQWSVIAVVDEQLDFTAP